MDGNWKTTESSLTLYGVVRWYNSLKGYGFVCEERTGRDYLIHKNTIQNFGQNSISEGTEVSFLYVETLKGLKVKEILDLGISNDELMTVPAGTDDKFAIPARVKWFDAEKGFGFLNEFGSKDDIFVHIDTLRAYGFEGLIAGEATSAIIGTNEVGKFAVSIHPWH